MRCEIFLDSCIFQSYAIPFEGKQHEMCDIVINRNEYEKYTSDNVIQEINRRRDRRLKFYTLLLQYLNLKGDIERFNPRDFDKNIFLSENDLRHLQGLIHYLANQKDILATLRLYQRMYKALLEEAIKKLVEVVLSENQPYLTDLLVIDIHRDDAKIIVDAYFWSEKRKDPIFLSSDGDIIFKTPSIIETLHDYCEISPPTNLRILHLSDFIRTFS